MKKLVKIGLYDKSFYSDGTGYSVQDITKDKKKVWVLHKRFGRKVSYRILSDVSSTKPIAIQCLNRGKAS